MLPIVAAWSLGRHSDRGENALYWSNLGDEGNDGPIRTT